jgi:hypothetical protein
VLAGAVGGLAVVAGAYIPAVDRVIEAVADANRASGRAQALKIELLVSQEGGKAIATGELVTHPTGMARLELRGARDLVERHLLEGSRYRAARGGNEVNDPRPFLPPLFLLQADDGLALEAALATFGVDPDAIALGPCGDRDCYVVGGRPTLAAGDANAGDPRAGTPPSIWVDTESLELAAIVERGGVRVRLGPSAQFDKVRMPQWLLIEEPGRRPTRLEVQRVAPVNAPANAFSDDWLLAP